MLKIIICRNKKAMFALFFFSSIIIYGYDIKGSSFTVSVNQLSITPDNYVNESVFIKGFLSRSYAKGSGRLLLYATKDDGFMRNYAASIPINLFKNKYLTKISKCEEHFVEIKGVFRRSNDPNIEGGLSISDISWMMIISQPKETNRESNIDEGICVHKKR